MHKIHWTTAAAAGVVLTLLGLMGVGYHISHKLSHESHEDKKITAVDKVNIENPEEFVSSKTKPTFDCAAYWRGEIHEPAEMTQARAKMIQFMAMGKSGRQDTFLALPEVAAAYAIARQNAHGRGYELRLSNANRPFVDQVTGYCSELENRGRVVMHAYPGKSNHGKGEALDVYLFRDGKQLNAISWHAEPTTDEEILRSIMESAGFERGKHEQWCFKHRN